MYYAVKVGKTPGIYGTWAECSANVTGFPGAMFHKFKALEEAESYMAGTKLGKSPKSDDQLVYPHAYVDGSYNPRTGVYGYGVVIKTSENSEPIKIYGADSKFQSMRNVAGECQGAIEAVKRAIKLGLNELTVYYDYVGIEAWATGSWEARVPGVIAYRDEMKGLCECIQIHFVKVQAHTGIEGNELVDSIAKAAVGIA